MVSTGATQMQCIELIFTLAVPNFRVYNETEPSGSDLLGSFFKLISRFQQIIMVKKTFKSVTTLELVDQIHDYQLGW